MYIWLYIGCCSSSSRFNVPSISRYWKLGGAHFPTDFHQPSPWTILWHLTTISCTWWRTSVSYRKAWRIDRWVLRRKGDQVYAEEKVSWRDDWGSQRIKWLFWMDFGRVCEKNGPFRLRSKQRHRDTKNREVGRYGQFSKCLNALHSLEISPFIISVWCPARTISTTKPLPRIMVEPWRWNQRCYRGITIRNAECLSVEWLSTAKHNKWPDEPLAKHGTAEVTAQAFRSW